MSDTRLIYCIGDSHANFFAGWDSPTPAWPEPDGGLLPGFRTFRLGPVLAYNIGSPGTMTQGREKLMELLARDVPRGAPLLFCLGEIDCRAHLIRQARLQNRSAESVAHECADRYAAALRGVQAMGFRVMAWNAIPSCRLDTVDDRDYPAEGDCLARNAVTRAFNDQAARLCRESGIAFISIFDGLVDAQGLTDARFYRDDMVHLSQRAMPMALQAIGQVVPDADLTRPMLYRAYASEPARLWRGTWKRSKETLRRLRKKVKRKLFGYTPPTNAAATQAGPAPLPMQSQPAGDPPRQNAA